MLYICSLQAKDSAFIMLSTMTATPGNFASVKVQLANTSKLILVVQENEDELVCTQIIFSNIKANNNWKICLSVPWKPM